jgi:hypothetical protein
MNHEARELRSKIQQRIIDLELDDEVPDRLLRVQLLEDVANQLDAGRYSVNDAREALKACADHFRDEDEADEAEGTAAEKASQVDKLVRLVCEEATELFHAPERTKYSCYADVMMDTRRETHTIGSSSLNEWMLALYFDRNNKALGSSVIDSANGVLRALARRGRECEVAVRTTSSGNDFYIDLAGPCWRAIHVAKDGWEVIGKPPVRFRRGGAMTALPVPERGGSIETLRPFLNVKDEDSFIMVIAWLLAALRPRGPYPILVINGEQGSAKSTMSKILRSLVDPSTAPLRHASRDDRDLFITATHSWVLAFDNCSTIPGWLSDALCRLATGGGFATRALYTDMDEVVFDAKRPIILNGITEFVERGDLADRSVFVHLRPIDKAERRTEKEVLGEFEKARPKILGALLDAMVEGLKWLPTIALPSKPRMAEFAEWAVACAPCFTVNEDDFLEAYDRNQATAIASVVEADPVASAIQEFAYRRNEKHGGEWEGNATELLEVLEPVAGEKVTKQRSWPKTSQAMGRAVARVAPALRQAGVPIDRPNRTGSKRLIVIGEAQRPKDRTELFDD